MQQTRLGQFDAASWYSSCGVHHRDRVMSATGSKTGLTEGLNISNRCETMSTNSGQLLNDTGCAVLCSCDGQSVYLSITPRHLVHALTGGYAKRRRSTLDGYGWEPIMVMPMFCANTSHVTGVLWPT